MNYISLLVSTKPEGLFHERLDDLFLKVKAEMSRLGLQPANLAWSRIFLSDSANQLELLENHPLFVSLLSRTAFSYVEQPPLDGGKIQLLLNLVPEGVVSSGTHDKCVLQVGGKRHLWQSIRFKPAETKGKTAYELTREAFRRHKEWLAGQGLTLKDNCVRTWFFVRDIDHNYHDVVVARNDVFDEEGLTSETHFIASTGIGGCSENPDALVSVDFWSVDDAGMVQKYLQALDYLNPTHEYGVAFERGVMLSQGNARNILISGTASIDKQGNCLYVGDVYKQTERLFLNIGKLLADGGMDFSNVRNMIVYLRDVSDYNLVKEYLDTRFPDFPKAILLAPVCRPHWLIEVECVASC
ncbi:MAG TPA: translation initiation inhibitor [Prevotellaceae bacterium]|nr:translation initiation inhibitor [Prevotellaceae bacterium]